MTNLGDMGNREHKIELLEPQILSSKFTFPRGFSANGGGATAQPSLHCNQELLLCCDKYSDLWGSSFVGLSTY